MNGRVNKIDDSVVEVSLPSDVPKLINMVPEEKENRILAREELDDMLRGGQENRIRLDEFHVSPKLLGLKDVFDKDSMRHIKIRDVINDRLINIIDL